MNVPLRPWEKEEYLVIHGVPSEGHVPWQSFESHRDLAMHNGAMAMVQKYEKHVPRFKFKNYSVGHQYTPVAREQLAQQALADQADFILMTDDDMIYPMDLFFLLARHNVDIVAPLAFTHNPPHTPVAYTYRSAWDPVTRQESFQKILPGNLPKNTLVRCDAVGFGAVLINTKILKEITPPWFANSTGSGEDIYFCITAGKKGFKTYMDTSIKTIHIGHNVLIDEALAQKHWDALALEKTTASTAAKYDEQVPQNGSHAPPAPVLVDPGCVR
mgnify:CR=1 FL=1